MKRTMLLLVPALVLLLFGAASAEAPERTGVRYFTPLSPDGEIAADLQVDAEAEGECFAPSLASPGRPDAWRCSAGNRILEPCFGAPAGQDDAVRLACAGDPFGGEITMLTLSEELPASAEPATEALPWAVELGNSERCTLLTGATASLAGKRIDYGCEGGGVVAGGVNRSGPVWTVLYQAKGDAYLEQVPVERAWY
ncbi:MAG TPA: hypothetical protein VK092_08965 [Deinococcales bacterium]|nr:hypothetical protein [Deinococcales bacterium]